MSSLLAYRVSLEEEPGDRFRLIFDCLAEDDDHAAEQAESAYPGCVVRHTSRRTDQDSAVPSVNSGMRKCAVEEVAILSTMMTALTPDTGDR